VAEDPNKDYCSLLRFFSHQSKGFPSDFVFALNIQILDAAKTALHVEYYGSLFGELTVFFVHHLNQIHSLKVHLEFWLYRLLE